MSTNADTLKAQGNQAFAARDYAAAVDAYTLAIAAVTDVQSDRQSLLLACYKNLAQAQLKLGKHAEAAEAATKALAIAPNDVKALYRRAQARIALRTWEDAFVDLRLAMSLEPDNREIGDCLVQSMAVYQKEMTAKEDAAKPIRQLGSLLDASTNFDQPSAAKAASEKMLGLSGDKAFLAKLASDRGVQQIIGALHRVPTSDDAQDTMVNLIKTLTHLAADPYLAESIAKALPSGFQLNRTFNSNLRVALIGMFAAMAHHAGAPTISAATENPKGTSANAITITVPVEQRSSMRLFTTIPDTAHKLFTLTIRDSDETVQAAAINALITVIGNPVAAEAFVKSDALALLLNVGGLHHRKRASQLAPVALAKIFETLGYKQKDIAKQACKNALTDKFDENDNNVKIQALFSLAMLFQADPEVAASVFLQEGLLDDLVDGVEFDTEETMVALCEVLAQASNEKSCRLPIATKALDFLVLKLMATNPRLSIRAAVALTKASTANMEARKEILEKTDAANHILKLLADRSLPVDVRQWAVEGAAYLSINPEMKERIVKQPGVLDSLFELARNDDKPLLYGITSIMANLARFRRKLNEEEEQMQKLREFAKEAVNKPHPLDDDTIVTKRIDALVSRGGVSALVQLCKIKSANIHEAISQIFLSMAVEKKHRGLIMQQGGVSSLLHLANDGTAEGMETAAHALAKVAVTMDPNLAFKGQKAAELIRPLLCLLKSEDGLKNFEALLALTNLTSSSEDLRMRVIHEKGLALIEDHLFSDNLLIRRAATETLCNMAMCDEVYDRYDKAGASDKIKLLLALSDHEDFETRRAASGALAMLSSSANVCKHINSEQIGLPVLLSLLKDGVQAEQGQNGTTKMTEGTVEDVDDEGEKASNDEPQIAPLTPDQGIQLQHRALVVLSNMSRDGEIAKAIVDSGLGEVIQLLVFSKTPVVQQVATTVKSNLDAAAAVS